MTIIVDAMGGAHGPTAAVEAASVLSLERNLDVLLVGDEGQITAALAAKAHNPEQLMVRHATAGEGQSVKEASIDLSMKLLARGQGSALVTAGDAQHVLVAANQNLTPLTGVPQPALCAVYPTLRRRGEHRDPYTLILDVGASMEATPEALAGFARMGSAYAARISRNPKPRVALLISQAGAAPGPSAVEQAAALLASTPGIEYIGGIGGVDIARGAADVVICSGFVGNVVIQLLEGVPLLVNQLVRAMEDHGIQKRLALRVLNDDIGQIRSLTDWRHYGGAPLLGYDRAVIVTQSDVDGAGFATSIKLAAKAVREDIVGAVRAVCC